MEEEKYWYVDPATLEWVGPFTSEKNNPTPTTHSPLRWAFTSEE